MAGLLWDTVTSPWAHGLIVAILLALVLLRRHRTADLALEPPHPAESPERKLNQNPAQGERRGHERSQALYDPVDGYMLLQRVLDPRFIYRRADKYTFEGADRMRHQVSIDTDVPPELFRASDPKGRGPKRAVVPLTFLRKRLNEYDQAVLRGFDVRDESGRALQVLGQRDNSLASWCLLVCAARRQLGIVGSAERGLASLGGKWARRGRRQERRLRDEETGLTTPELDFLWHVVSTPREDALPVTMHFLGGELNTDARPDLEHFRLQEGTHPHLLWLREHPSGAIRALMWMLALHYVLLIEVQEDPALGRRRLFKYGYDAPPPFVQVGPGATRSRIARVEELFSAAGLWRQETSLEAGRPLPCRSAHLELHAPMGVGLRWSRAVWRTLWGARQHRPDNQLGHHPSVAHVHVGTLLMGTALGLQTLFYRRATIETGLGVFGGVALWGALQFGRQMPLAVFKAAEVSVPVLLLLPALVGSVLVTRATHALPHLLGRPQRLAAFAIMAISVIAAGVAIPAVATYGSSQVELAERGWEVLQLLTLAPIVIFVAPLIPRRSVPDGTR